MDSHLTAPAPEVAGAGQVHPTDDAPPLPVALRKEITEADVLALAQKATHLNGSQSVRRDADGDPALTALREAQARRASQSRRRHARMDRELEELAAGDKGHAEG